MLMFLDHTPSEQNCHSGISGDLLIRCCFCVSSKTSHYQAVFIVGPKSIISVYHSFQIVSIVSLLFQSFAF